MLLVLRKFELGGIQTLFVKLANALAVDHERVAIMSLESKDFIDQSLMNDLHPDVRVLFIEDYLKTSIIPSKLLLLRQATEEFKCLVESYCHIHVADMYSMIFFRKLGLVDQKIISVGVYHPNEILNRFSNTWLHFRIDLSVFKDLPPTNIFFFNSTTFKNYRKVKSDLQRQNVLPIGVLSEKYVPFEFRERSEVIKILVIGRMSLNKLYFLGIVKIFEILLDKGYDCDLTIVGSGPLHKHVATNVRKSSIKDKITLVDKVMHRDLQRFATSFDIVLASGTTLIECVAYGCIGISAVEASEDFTNGYLSEVWDKEYSANLLPDCVPIVSLVSDTIDLSETEWSKRREKEYETAQKFRIDRMIMDINAQAKYTELKKIPFTALLIYEFSRLLFGLLSRLSFIKKSDKYIN